MDMSALILGILVFLLLIFQLASDRFASNFKALALLYMMFFYVLPAMQLDGQHSIVIGGVINYINIRSYKLALWALPVLILGFYAVDIYKPFVARNLGVGRTDAPVIAVTPSRYFYAFILATILISAYFYITDAAAASYAARQGLIESSWLAYFAKIITISVAVSIFLVSCKFERKGLVALAAVALIICAFSLGGRARLLIALALICLYFSK